MLKRAPPRPCTPTAASLSGRRAVGCMMSPMKLAALFLSILGMAVVSAGQAPAPEQRRESGPLSRVTLVVRTTKAINYRHLSGPTRIDFRGTVLQSQARGEARV